MPSSSANSPAVDVPPASAAVPPGDASPRRLSALGIDGFSYADLYSPDKLAGLAQRFYAAVDSADAELGRHYQNYRQTLGDGLKSTEEAELLVKLAPHLATFIAKLFQIDDSRETLRRKVKQSDPVFQFRNDFVQKRVHKRAQKGEPPSATLAELTPRMHQLCSAVLGEHAETLTHDEELAIARTVLVVLQLANAYTNAHKQPITDAQREHVGELAARLGLATPPQTDADATRWLGDLLSFCENWGLAKHREQAGIPPDDRWVSFWHPEAMDFANLIAIQRPRGDLPQQLEGPEFGRRFRDGFGLTDPRMTRRQMLGQVDYCLYCHERDKDSCSKGFKEKQKPGDPARNTIDQYKKNALGVPLTGCPLDERISEMHVLEKAGDTIAALAVCMIDNPMCPGTGHRICNECMRACIFQKQTPVNIPQIETGILTEVVYQLPWGFEIYSLLTRWNPLNVRRPYQLPYNGKNVLVVGMGPAGYTLAHYLLNEGFGVVGIDGLKIEPMNGRAEGSSQLADATGEQSVMAPRPMPHNQNGSSGEQAHDVNSPLFLLPAAASPRPIHNYKTELYQNLDERVLLGFGGVSEYGITVRWDKNFLAMIYLSLTRRETFKLYGGVRFGGTLTIEDAWQLGFDHIAVATGAGRPTFVRMKNNLLRGIRKASDFLMALQLTGAGRRRGLSNLQVRLPAVVVGGGLTGVDTCTELMAYYPVQCEKTLQQFEALSQQQGADAFLQSFRPDEREILLEQLEHGRAIRAERQAAQREHRDPNFQGLIRQWGGVKLAYRKRLQDSPAYRQNFEEVAKALEEGIEVVECVSPTEAHPDKYGAVEALTFDVLDVIDGKWQSAGRSITLPARTVCIAAGTSPNTMYEREYPGTFKRDEDDEFFLGYKVRPGPSEGARSVSEAAPSGATPGVQTLETVREPHLQNQLPAAEHDAIAWSLEPAHADDRDAFFTSYHDGRHFITYYGDNHPAYAGNVVKAMASAKQGFPHVAKLFEHEIRRQSNVDQPSRDLAWRSFAQTLDDLLIARVERVDRLTPNIVEVIVKAPLAARKFQPGQFYRFQNYETYAPTIDGTKLVMEGLALTGAWKDDQRGLLSLIVLEMGASSRLCATLRPGEPVVCMGPTGAPTEIPEGQTVLLAGGGLGNAVLFSIGQALREKNCRVLYFAGYKKPTDVFKPDAIEASADQVIWCADVGPEIPARRPQDRSFVGNIVQAIDAYGRGALGGEMFKLQQMQRIIAIGSDRMMRAVKDARCHQLAGYFDPSHFAVGSINSPMQCAMKEICAQCLQRHVDPKTGKEQIVFSCFNQDQPLDFVDFDFLNSRLQANSMQEKMTNAWLDHLLQKQNVLRV